MCFCFTRLPVRPSANTLPPPGGMSNVINAFVKVSTRIAMWRYVDDDTPQATRIITNTYKCKRAMAADRRQGGACIDEI